MKHYLITGGAGFIGSHLIEKLLTQADIHITCIDNFDSYYPVLQKLNNIESFIDDPRVVLLDEDISQHDVVVKRIEKSRFSHMPFDAIIHLAAKAGVRGSLQTTQEYYQTNVMGTLSMLEIARNFDIPQFIFASSSSVYGTNPRIPWAEEDLETMPISPYASSKLSGEVIGQVYAHLYGIRFVALRFFTVYGPRQRPDLAIHKFTELIQQHQPVPLYGTGDTSRDYTYVEDIVEGIRLAIDYQDSPYEIFNLGSGQPISLKHMVTHLEQALHMEAMIDYLPEQPGDVPQTFADIAKARTKLGYRAHTSIAEGIQHFVDWKLGHNHIQEHDSFNLAF
ncbi:GDP-mannose 4,6-dehydratase [Cytophagaceae bacterium YF14B1]|uniref:GDP-mannose 4,6-dehydratase n=1 Tax=Xanthocytophaga flava TaxID=3048013 RepID=A0AAE3UD17_9BACT|nr:GDP-mannose 4,6-dehydratase [Xanthocytophaga flavus]MDJ1485434.1 GDP-mannose 4,6-dehydratase [Xanthocytophaga flavus]